jgi:negative regulator of sigma E activity
MMSNESLSALLDGECSPAELDRLLDQMGTDPALMQGWTRLCAAREARDGARAPVLRQDLAAGIMVALEAAPRTSTVISLPVRRKSHARGSWSGWAGWAAAASIAAVALLVNLPGNRAEITPQAPGLVQDGPVRGINNPTARDLRTVSLSPPAELDDEDPLANYLMEHNNTLANQGMAGTLRYTRFAAHTAQYRVPEGQR